VTRALLAAALLASMAAALIAQADPNREAWVRVDDYARLRAAEVNTPGMSLAVTSRDQLLHVAAYGFANIDAKRPVTPETLFEIGSISKSFTAVALLQLRDEGAFDPQLPIVRYLPWFQITSKFAPIAGHHLMSHTAGFPRDRDDVPSSRYQAYGVREREAGYEPGVHYAYSNVGYQVLGYALESIARQRYPDVIAERILRPLRMRATEAQFTHETRPRLAVGYDRLYDDRPSHPSHPLVPAPWLEYAAGDGSIVSTAADMAAYARMLLNRGRGPDGGRVLSDESFNLLTQRAIPSGDSSWYGYGIATSERQGRVLLSHSGGMVGYSSYLVIDPAAGVGAVAMVNGPGDPTGVARYALDVARAVVRNEALPAAPPSTDLRVVPNAQEYEGTYGSGAEAVTVKASDGGLLLTTPHGAIRLERRGDDAFFVNHPKFDRFLLRVGRERHNDQPTKGAVVALTHGATWLPRAAGGPSVAPSPTHPAEWNAYVGHYRTTHAWFNNFRIVVRRGALYLMSPDGSETKMEPLGPALFKEEGLSAERLRFDSVVEGKSLRANLSGVDYYRVFTP
jgi:CubicO group peptidase (beta-lactamase class C family)